MWPAAGAPEGTFYFNNEPNMLDQFLVNANMAREDSPIRADPGSVHIVRFPDIIHDGASPNRGRSAGWANRSTRTASPTTFPSPCT
jgi:hypothetical protein